MQLFYLEPWSHSQRAKSLCDQHLGKALVEVLQLLCNTHRILDRRTHLRGVRLYESTHVQHPLSRWVMESADNYSFLVKQATHYACECKFRFRKLHNSTGLIIPLRDSQPVNLPYYGGSVPPNLTNRKDLPLVEAYRVYYAEKLRDWATRKHKKRIIATWTGRSRPVWLPPTIE
jgi:hypothetical protein